MMAPPQTLGCPTLPTTIETQQYGFFGHVTKVPFKPLLCAQIPWNVVLVVELLIIAQNWSS
jgi:hypothetical protein